MITPSARAAAEAGTTTRREAFKESVNAYFWDLDVADRSMSLVVDTITDAHITTCRTALTACLAHLDELARLIAQRDGYADPRQGMLRELTEGDEPGVVLNGWGSKR
jgi:hypothetical protein